MIDPVALKPFITWYNSLTERDQDNVQRVVDLLCAEGVNLGFPHSSAVAGSSIALRELRIQSKGQPLRVFYVFDAVRNAVLIIGGNKKGDGQFYERMVRDAETIYQHYLDELE